MKRSIIFCVLFALFTGNVMAQVQRQRERVGTVIQQPQTQQPQGQRSYTPQPPRVFNSGQILRPVAMRVKHFQYSRELVMRPMMQSQQNRVQADIVNKSGNNSNTGNNLKNRQFMSQGSQYAEMMMDETITKKLPNGKNARFTLVHNTKGWANMPLCNVSVAATTNNSSDVNNCTVNTVSFNAQSTSFMNADPNRNGSHLKPGAIYTFDDLSGGNFNNNTFLNNRNPITLVVNAHGNGGQNINVTSTVQNPNDATLTQGISDIVSQFGPYQGGFDSQTQTFSSSDITDLSIQISAGGSYCGFSAQGNYGHDDNKGHLYYYIDHVLSLYTVSAQQTNGSYFINGQMPQTNSEPVMLQNVTYGARIMGNIDIQYESVSDIAGLNLSYQTPGASASIDLSALASNKKITCKMNLYAVGTGKDGPIASIHTIQDYQTQVDAIIQTCNYNTAMPIQYELVDMKGNSMGIHSITDQFNSTNCVPKDEVFVLKSVYGSIDTGDDGKNGDTDFWLQIYDKNKGNNDDGKVAEFKVLGREGKEVKNNTTITFPVNISTDRVYTLDDFKNGGSVFLKMIAHNAKSDDWKMSSLVLNFTFMSQKGTPKTAQYRTTSDMIISDSSPTTLYFDNTFMRR